MKYQESNYFKEGELVLFYVDSIKRYYLKPATFYNGSWFGGNYKLSSVRALNFSEVYSTRISFKGFSGRIIKGLEDSFGILWDQGQKDIPYFWNDVNKLEYETIL